MAIKGDFLGFTFNSRHSSDMGIIHVSDGSRYSDDLLPTSQDKTVQVPGGHGTYFFGTYYTQKQFSINFATDELTELQFRSLRTWLQTDGIHDLIFDERPYKIYSAKVTGTPTFKYICFGNPRVYKGEGTIQFTCFYPFARSNFKYLNLYTDANYPNKEEWAGSSGLLSTKGIYDGTGTSIKLFNSGDMETDFKAYYAISNSSLTLTEISLGDKVLNFAFDGVDIQDQYICINSKTHLIEGCDSNKKPTGNLYNYCISSGDFFKIPIINNTSETVNFVSTGASCNEIRYDYLYY